MTEKVKRLTRLRNWSDVDQALLEIGKLSLEIERIDAAHNLAVQDLLRQLQARRQPLVNKKASLALAVEKFIKAHCKDFADKRSIRLTWGLCGIRSTTRLVTTSTTWAGVLSKLKELGWFSFIRRKEEVDIQALRKASVEQLNRLGVRLKRIETPYFEINITAITGKS